MSQLEQRLKQMKAYRDVAIAHGDPSDKLYIEDLNLSISVFEAQLKYANPVVQKGWIDEQAN